MWHVGAALRRLERSRRLRPPPSSSCHRIAVQIRSHHGSGRPDGDGQAASDLFIKG